MLTERLFDVSDEGCRNVVTGPSSGAPLLLVHGVTRQWQCFLPMIPSLVANWTVYGIDLRGHGKSEHVSSGYHVVDYSKDVIAFLKQEVKQPTILYGHSLGAMIVAQVAAEVPELTRAVVMEDPPFSTLGEAIDTTHFHSYFLGMQRALETRENAHELAGRLAEISVTSPDGSSDRLGNVRPSTQLLFMAQCLMKIDPRILDPIVSGEWLKGYSLKSILPRIQCPSLLLQADWDKGGMLTDGEAVRVAETLTQCCHVRMSSVGHQIHWLETENLLRHLVSFLAALD